MLHLRAPPPLQGSTPGPSAAAAQRLCSVPLLLAGFASAAATNVAFLRLLEPDRLFFNMRATARLPQPKAVRPYGGWEAPGAGIRGHFVGVRRRRCASQNRISASSRGLRASAVSPPRDLP